MITGTNEQIEHSSEHLHQIIICLSLKVFEDSHGKLKSIRKADILEPLYIIKPDKWEGCHCSLEIKW
jgi:hypothetical protein